MPLIFDTAPADPGATEAEISIGNYMRGAWAAFAKNPTSGLLSYNVDGTTGGWPSYDPSKDSLVRLGWNNITGVNAVAPFTYDADCPYVVLDSPSTSALPYNPSGVSGPSSTSSGGSSLAATGSATSTGPSASKTSAKCCGENWD